jgi:RNA polymerase sigma-70 factor (ECF subfamily)
VHEGKQPTFDLEALVDKYSAMVISQAYFYLKDRQRAEDICQDVFLRLYNKKPLLPDAQSEKAYILRVTINACKDYLKSAWNRKVSYICENYDAPSPCQTPESTVVDMEQKQLLLDCVMELPDIYKDVILLFYYQELSTEEIARVLGVPGVTVRTRLMRARDKLQTLLRRRQIS